MTNQKEVLSLETFPRYLACALVLENIHLIAPRGEVSPEKDQMIRCQKAYHALSTFLVAEVKKMERYAVDRTTPFYRICVKLRNRFSGDAFAVFCSDIRRLAAFMAVTWDSITGSIDLNINKLQAKHFLKELSQHDLRLIMRCSHVYAESLCAKSCRTAHI